MVVYVERGVVYAVRWSSKPWTIRQTLGEPPQRLVAIRLVGDRLEVGVEAPGQPVMWVDPALYITEDEGIQWARRGFARSTSLHPGRASPRRHP